MAVELYERGTIIRSHTYARSHELRGTRIQRCLPEPPSALFVYAATLITEGVNAIDDPMRASMRSRIQAEWRPEALKMLEALRQHIPDMTKIARTGAAYLPIGTKRYQRWLKYMDPLIYQSHQIWQRPWWREWGAKRMQEMVQVIGDRTIENLEVLRLDPELVIGDKPPGTGTGWVSPINTRGDMAQNLPRYIDAIQPCIRSYTEDFIAAFDYWPEKDVKWHITSPLYRGIFGGVRSDAEVVKWDWNTLSYEADTGAREVGNTVESAFHNRKLNASFNRAFIDRFMTKYHLPIYDVTSYHKLFTTPPVTMVDDGEVGLLSVDFGYTEPTPRMEKSKDGWQIVQGAETVKLGADNISLVGMFPVTAERREIAMLKSGASITARHYDVVAGGAIADCADRLGIPLKLVEVGDDLHIFCTPEEAQLILADMGNWLRVKGMTKNTNFILGRQFIWHDKENMIAMIIPRAIKSVSSAQKAKELREMELYDQLEMRVAPTAIEQADQFWRDYPEMVYFDGSKDDYLGLLRSMLPKTVVQISDLTGSAESMAQNLVLGSDEDE